ncbi:uncharacterized protein BDZ99DRAFT_514075 [Mytilinidion resinicola]|uniref:Uncharacterized protein n=1 Tax=Mytilinidion resinicola TaxID=574789 RepID=A0A6A6Z9Q9_9PEZI|nr:uncharacterized protein BDZ99DRAFT_514075 [Mytilinidion resinicola]KAF2817861.1 hypothetical protein BDZ99DRAFT_514075 [Mytilinidion resinicola]
MPGMGETYTSTATSAEADSTAPGIQGNLSEYGPIDYTAGPGNPSDSFDMFSNAALFSPNAPTALLSPTAPTVSPITPAQVTPTAPTVSPFTPPSRVSRFALAPPNRASSSARGAEPFPLPHGANPFAPALGNRTFDPFPRVQPPPANPPFQPSRRPALAPRPGPSLTNPVVPLTNPTVRPDFNGSFTLGPFPRENVIPVIERCDPETANRPSLTLESIPEAVTAIQARTYFTNGCDLIGFLWRDLFPEQVESALFWARAVPPVQLHRAQGFVGLTVKSPASSPALGQRSIYLTSITAGLATTVAVSMAPKKEKAVPQKGDDRCQACRASKKGCEKRPGQSRCERCLLPQFLGNACIKSGQTPQQSQSGVTKKPSGRAAVRAGSSRSASTNRQALKRKATNSPTASTTNRRKSVTPAALATSGGSLDISALHGQPGYDFPGLKRLVDNYMEREAGGSVGQPRTSTSAAPVAGSGSIGRVHHEQETGREVDGTQAGGNESPDRISVLCVPGQPAVIQKSYQQ